MRFSKRTIKRERVIRNLECKKHKMLDKLKELKSKNQKKHTWILHMEYNTNYGKIERQKRKIRWLNHKMGVYKSYHFDILYDILVDTDDCFKQLASENIALIAGKKIRFKNKDTGFNMMSSHTTIFNGELFNSGVIKCASAGKNLALLDIQKGLYPKSYNGSINALGLIGMKISERGFAIGGKIPVYFSGYIDDKGSFKINTDADYYEFSGNQYVKYLEGNIQFKDPSGLYKFLQNKDLLIGMIDRLRQSIQV